VRGLIAISMLTVLACSTDVAPLADAGGGAGVDASATDAGLRDSGDAPRDAGRLDSEPTDALPGDALPTDAGSTDALPRDAEPPRDGGPSDALPPDSDRDWDVGVTDAEPTDGASDPDGGNGDGGTSACGPGSPSPAPTCGAACGNGVREACEVCDGPGPRGAAPAPLDAGASADAGNLRPPPPLDAGPMCTEVTETCDGTDLGGRSCRALGYAGGVLRCHGWCAFDVSDCTTCASGADVSRCADVWTGTDSTPALALAASGSELGLAWVQGGVGVQVQLHDEQLGVLARRTCVEGAVATQVALAPTSTGWLLAVSDGTATALHPLAADLQANGAIRAIRGQQPQLVAGSAGPLLTYVDATGVVMAAGLDASGASLWTASVFSGVVGAEFVSAVETGAGQWMLAARTRGGVEIARIAGGQVAGRSNPVGGSTEYPNLAWTGTEARLVYTDFATTGQVRWARLDAQGALIGASVALGTIPDFFNSSPVVTVGDASYAFLGGYTGTTAVSDRLALVRIDATGASVSVPSDLAIGPELVRPARATVLRGAPFVAWVGAGAEGRVNLARITP
jgi:hypothetical protein